MNHSSALSDSLLRAIRQADSGRRVDLLRLKYQAMRQSRFRFYRATPYLFYEAWSSFHRDRGHPMSWVCGDLHLENIGSYRAANGLTYFDINDFDEAQLAPCTVDLARLVTSLLVAAHDWRIPAKVTHSLAWRLIQAYKQRLWTCNSTLEIFSGSHRSGVKIRLLLCRGLVMQA